MKRAAICVTIIFSQVFVSQIRGQFVLSNYATSNSTATFTGGNKSFSTEIPPWIVKGGWRQYYFTTFYTAVWSSPVSLGTTSNQTISVVNDNVNGYGPTWILSSSNWWTNFIDPNYLNSSSYQYRYQWQNYHWRRNYNGVFSAHVMANTPTNQNIIFAISHGENKNEKAGNYFYQNTVRPSMIVNPNDPTTYSGYQGGVYVDDGNAYNAFVNGNWIPYDAAHDWGATYLNDLGPIVWPTAGYIDSLSNHTSFGVRQPSSIVYNGYLYIYVIDNSFDGNGGVKLVRCAINNVLTPANYETWSSTTGWIPSLPAGFTKETAANFFNKRGPQNTSIFSDAFNTIRFAVAQFNNTNTFIGVESFVGSDNVTQYIAFRLSTDLINWTSRTNIIQASNWGTLNLRYPIFLSKDGNSNTAIDQNDFYVLGSTSTNNVINKMHFVQINGRMYDPCVGSRSSSVQNRNMPGTAPCAVIAESSSDRAVISAFPNPAINAITLRFYNSIPGALNFVFYDSKGQVQHTIESFNPVPGWITKSIEVSSLPAGTYVVTIKEGNKMRKVKFVKN